MTQRKASAILWTVLFASACAGAPKSTPATMTSGPVLGELPPQDLARGQCALVLWAQQMPPQRVFVSLNDPAIARVDVGGKVVELARVSQSGQPLFGQFPKTHYRGGGLSLDVSFVADKAKELNGGAVVSSALVEYVDAQGWTTVIPAAGLIGCQT
jgi:hypothetical protein